MDNLHLLAERYGIETHYQDTFGKIREAHPDILVPVLKALGCEAPVPLPPIVDPINVLWEGREGKMPRISLHLPLHHAESWIKVFLRLENGEIQSSSLSLKEIPALHSWESGDIAHVRKEIPLPPMPWGYHHLRCEIQGHERGQDLESLLISSPATAFRKGLSQTQEREWGGFLPLYAIDSEKNWGSGNYSDLERLLEWTQSMEGNLVSTLPLLPTFLDHPFDPSPYAPVSRLFWNEFYIDIEKIPELPSSPEALEILRSPEVQALIDSFHQLPLVDYRRLHALQRQILTKIARAFWSRPSARFGSFQGFLQKNQDVTDYSEFRAAGERQGLPWSFWETRLKERKIRPGDYKEETKRYYQYAQWIAHEQMDSVARRFRETGGILGLDYPLGVHPHGYDAWRERDLFVEGANAGAPPDSFFHKGQNWGFHPPHPQKMRAQKYRYFIRSLRHQMASAGILRMDHIMSLHRLFWIPEGAEPGQGVYVRYPADELYAILVLESQRNKVEIVGEDLGTVPEEVRIKMKKHGIYSTYVAQYEMGTSKNRPDATMPPPPADSLACLNTHDMPPFAGFWDGLDIERRHGLGLMDESEYERQRLKREALKDSLLHFFQTEPILEKCLDFLGASAARYLLINLEDLWRETEPQNIPGTGAHVWNCSPNWHRKAIHPLEVFSKNADVLRILHRICERRREKSDGRISA